MANLQLYMKSAVVKTTKKTDETGKWFELLTAGGTRTGSLFKGWSHKIVDNTSLKVKLEPEFLNFYGDQESIPRNQFRSLCSLAGR
jgi:hypothetical protein